MSFVTNLVHHPRRLWLRRALFQIHLWLGVLLSLYVVVIGLSGSALVWEDEIQAYAYRLPYAMSPMHRANLDDTLRNVAAAYPKDTITYVMWPQVNQPVFTVYLDTANHGARVVHDMHPSYLMPERRMFIDWVHDLHVYLLMGQTGFKVNCIAGIGLLVLALTGVILWWPGLRAWVRGFYINLRAGWKRINFDAHNAIGIWTLAIVSFWGLSAVDFLFPAGFQNTVNAIAPLQAMKEPAALVPQHIGAPMALPQIAAKARSISPNTPLSGISVPAAPTGNYVAYMDSRAPGDFSHRTILTFARDGQLLATWHYGENKTLGDWIVWLVYPLHFGTLWGVWVKVLWTVLGMSLPVLSSTGLLMYWNRFLGRRWKALRTS